MKTKPDLLIAASLMASLLTGVGQPVILTQPTSQTVYLGASVIFDLEFTADGAMFQWRFYDADLGEPQFTSRLELPNVQFTNAGPYAVVIEDFNGSVTSQVAWLSVLPTNIANLGDLELSFGESANLTALNSPMDDDASSLAADGLTLYFDSIRAGGVGGWDIWSSTRPTAAAPWSIPVNLGPQINSTTNDGDPRISADRLSLYFDSERPGGVGGADIWVTTRSPLMSAWEDPPVNLGAPVNSRYNDVQPSLSADDLTLVFASDRPGGPGGLADLWMTTRTSRDAAWNEPVNLAELNSGRTELYPTLSPDGLWLFFLSSVTSEPNGNVWVSKRPSRSSPFAPPLHVDSIATTAQRARPHALSYDGMTLYYSSFNRPGGQGGWDLWQISVTKLPQLLARGVNGQGEFQVELLGREGATYEIETSTDCHSWTHWLTTNTTDRVTLSDPAQAAEVRRFYRALSH